MHTKIKSDNKLISIAASNRLALILFIILACLLVPTTLLKVESPLLDWCVRISILAVSINLSVCTFSKIKRLDNSVVCIHFGVLVILFGSFLTSLGYVATRNVYENDFVDKVYRWDLERLSPLGGKLRLNEIRREYYPVELRIGVLKNGEKYELRETKTGIGFNVDDIYVDVVGVDPQKEEAELKISLPNGKDVSVMTNNSAVIINQNLAYDFRLVAYKNPVVKQYWADVVLQWDNRLEVQKSIGINEPLIYKNIRFYLTKVDTDKAGNPYAGFQITYDPGVWIVYAGFGVLLTGLCFFLLKMVRRPRSSIIRSQ